MAAKFFVRLGATRQEVEVIPAPEGWRARIGDRWYQVSLEPIGQTGLFSLIVDGHPYDLFGEEDEQGFRIIIGSKLYPVAIESRATPTRPPRPAPRPPAAGDWLIRSPMAGVVTEVHAAPGDLVEAGTVLLVIEAMKMNNEIRAQHRGTVKEVYVSKGQRIEPGTRLLRLAGRQEGQETAS